MILLTFVNFQDGVLILSEATPRYPAIFIRVIESMISRTINLVESKVYSGDEYEHVISNLQFLSKVPFDITLDEELRRRMTSILS